MEKKANGDVVWYTRFRHRGKKVCVPTKAKSEEECRAIEEKIKRDLDLGVENGDRRGRLLTKLAYEYVQWLLTYRSQEHALRTDLALSTILEKLPVKHVYKLKPDHSGFHRVELVESSPTVKVPAEVSARLRSVVEKGLYEKGTFARGPDLRIFHTFVSHDPGSQFERWFWSGLGNAAEASLIVMVRYLDSTDTELAQTHVEGRIVRASSAAPLRKQSRRWARTS